MTEDFVLVVRWLFYDLVRLFTSWHIPGTMVTPAEFAMFSLAVSFAIRLVLRYFGGQNPDE